MKIVKLVAIWLFGLIVGLLISQHFLTEATQNFEDAQKGVAEIYVKMMNDVHSSDIRELNNAVESLALLVSMEKDGDSSKEYIQYQILEIKNKYTRMSEVVSAIDDSDIIDKYESLGASIERLDEDVIFYYGE